MDGSGRWYDLHWYQQEFKRRKWELCQAWDHAEEVSDRAGHPYKNRHGLMVYPRPMQVSQFDRIFMEITRMCREGEIEGFHV